MSRRPAADRAVKPARGIIVILGAGLKGGVEPWPAGLPSERICLVYIVVGGKGRERGTTTMTTSTKQGRRTLAHNLLVMDFISLLMTAANKSDYKGTESTNYPKRRRKKGLWRLGL